MLELDFAWKQMIENEFIKLHKVYNSKLKNKCKLTDSKLPLTTTDLNLQFENIQETIYEIINEEFCKKNPEKTIEIVKNLNDGW